MSRTPQRILLTYAGALVVLGVMLAVAEGFRGGWQIVGIKTAGLCVVAAIVTHVGTQLNRSQIRNAGALLGMLICSLASMNSIRLAVKWQQAEFLFDLKPVIAGLMAVGGFIVAVLLWRHTIASVKRQWALPLKRLTTVCGMLAIVAGLLISKNITAPQSASAIFDAAVDTVDLVERVVDVELTNRIVEEALNSESVQKQLLASGVSEQHIEQLSSDPALRAAAIEALRASFKESGSDDLIQYAQQIESQLNGAAPQADSATGNAAMPRLAPSAILAQYSEQELKQLARTMNIDPAEFSNSSAASVQIDPELIEQMLETHGTSTAIPQLTDTDIALPAPIRTPAGQRSADRFALAERIRPEKHSQRIIAERFVGSNIAGANFDELEFPNRSSHVSSDAQLDSQGTPTALLRLDELPASLLSGRRTQPGVDSIHEVQTTTVDSTTVAVMTVDNETAQPHVPANTMDVSELAAVAEAARAQYLAGCELNACRIPAPADPKTGPGAMLNQFGLVVVAIGVALVLCALAIGRGVPRHPAA